MNDRQQNILLYLATAEGPLTSDYLAQQLGVSSRTIKSDMAVIAQELQDNGAELVSRRNRGYSLQILDEGRFQSLYSLTSMKVGRTSSRGDGARMLYIARKLVAAPHGILLDELAEELYLSRGALRIPLREAVHFCESYHLQMVSIPGQGLQVVGEEHLRRLAATELFEMHFHTMELEQADQEYAKWVQCDYQERQDIRHTFLAVLRESPFSLLDMSTQRIGRYLVIARNRRREGHPIHLPAPWIREIRSSPLYQVATDIYSALARDFSGFQMDPAETSFLAVLLMLGLSPSFSAEGPEPIPYLSTPVADLARDLLDLARRRSGTEFNALPGAQALLQTTLLPLVIQARYGMDGYQTVGSQAEGRYLHLPAEAHFARIWAGELARRFQCKISTRDLSVLACCINTLLWQIEYPTRPLRLIMSNTDLGGKAFPQLISQRLKDRWPHLIESVEAMSLYEIRRLPPDSYDAVLLGHSRVRNSSTYYNYDAPHAFVLLNQPHQYFDTVYNHVLVDAFDFDSLFPKEEAFHLYEDFRYYDTEQAFQYFCARYARDDASEARLLSLLRQRERILTLARGSCAFLLAERHLCKEDCFHAYRLSKPGTWGEQKIDWIFFLTVPGAQPAALKALGVVLEELAKAPEKCGEFVRAPLSVSRQILRENMQIAQRTPV